MNFLYGLIFALLMTAFSLVYMKTYQLCGYNIKKFFNMAIALSLSLGKKNRLKFTKRVCRFIILNFFINYAIWVLIFAFTSHWLLIGLDLVVLLIFTPVIMAVTHFLILPIENAIKSFYMRKAKKVLSSKNCIKIGITGSYGKTSTKNILDQILSKDYKVCSTPKSYNTEMGIARTILEKLDDDDVFIAEMGARAKGDIEILTKLVNPDYAVITTIGPQHIESFGSLANIENTKFELLSNLNTNGKAIINGDSVSSFKLFKRCNREKYLTCKDGSFCYPKNIKISSKGSAFDLVLDGKVIPVETRLLGQCNIDNIVTAAALAHLMKISDEDIKDAILHLSPTPHRLEFIKSGSINIIDDSYNSNLTGAKEALNILKLFSGCKIVITPGFVEMGKEQSLSNFRFGAEIADVADFVIIMNEINKNFLLSGLVSHNFPLKNVFFAKTREEQEKLIKKLTTSGCVVLFENDLPDNFK